MRPVQSSAMNAYGTKRKRLSRLAEPRTAVLVFTLFAFFLQSLVTQTHIHGARFSDSGGVSGWLNKLSSGGEQGTATGSKKSQPDKDDSAGCPFCQATLHSGAFVTPAAIVLSAPVQTVSVVPLQMAALVVVAGISHFWHGRAPPQL
jgi:hypothetical protein